MSRGYWPGVLFEKRCYACGGQPRSAPPCQNILTLFGCTSAVQDIQNVVIDNALSEPQRNLSSCNRRRIESCYLQLHTFLLAERIKVFSDAILVLFPIRTFARPLLVFLGFPASSGILSLFGLFRLLPVFNRHRLFPIVAERCYESPSGTFSGFRTDNLSLFDQVPDPVARYVISESVNLFRA